MGSAALMDALTPASQQPLLLPLLLLPFLLIPLPLPLHLCQPSLCLPLPTRMQW